MYCPNCDLRVETDIAKKTDTEEAERYYRRFDDEDVRGDYDISEVGDLVEVENDDGSSTDWEVGLRVDICANCAVPIEARTYLHHWNV